MIVRPALSDGNWEVIAGLRARVDDASLRHWNETRSGGALFPRQLRFWELILDLPSGPVDQ